MQVEHIKCEGHDCPLKNNCYRFINWTELSEVFEEIPFDFENTQICDYFEEV